VQRGPPVRTRRSASMRSRVVRARVPLKKAILEVIGRPRARAASCFINSGRSRNSSASSITHSFTEPSSRWGVVVVDRRRPQRSRRRFGVATTTWVW